MEETPSPLADAQQFLKKGSPLQLAGQALALANSNTGRNVYLAQDRERILQEAAALESSSTDHGPLFGIPVSIKDCFDVAGYRTSCGSAFYNANNPISATDSWMAQRLRAAGAVITGKTHMHQIAYGITGESADFGDCLQPRNVALLTGGSSSGAAASVQEGSAIAAIGTDTGGSVRVPAALCGLAGYRSSVGVGSWAGGVHLAQSFDALGFLFRDLRDGPAIAQALFGISPAANDAAIRLPRSPRIAIAGAEFLSDCDAVVAEAYTLQKQRMQKLGATLHTVDTGFWEDAVEIFSTIQAHEAAAIQREKLAGRADFSVFEPIIAERLAWGETLSPDLIASFRGRHAIFRATMDTMLTQHDLLMLPCAPMHALRADDDHTTSRQQILRYTTPVSLAAMPAVALPQGIQLIAARGRDAALLAFAAALQ